MFTRDPPLFKGVASFGFSSRCVVIPDSPFDPHTPPRKPFRPDSKRRHAPLAQLCDAAAFFADEEVLSRDEQAAEFALDNFGTHVVGCR
jgi:hypothetical protein